MKKATRILAMALALSLFFAICTISASAADTEKIICFTNCSTGYEEVDATETEPAHRLYWAIVDGVQQQVKVLPEKMLLGYPGYNTWARPCTATFNEDGYIYKTRPVPDLLNGNSIYPAADGKITLGIHPEEYTYASDVKVYLASQYALIENYEISITELDRGWDDEWNIILNSAGEIQTMFVMTGVSSNDGTGTLYDEIAKFDVGSGPVDEDTGLSTEYLYYKPEIESTEKYPLVIWFHGMWGGISTWNGVMYYNDICRFASDEYQSAFTAGGAYVICPRSNEDLAENHNMSWNQLQVGSYELALDEFIENNPNVDTDRIYVGGYSMGGGMTWLAISSRPDYYAAAFPCTPISSYVPSGSELNQFAALPIWQTHGVADPVVTVTGTYNIMPSFAANAQAMGTDTRFLILEESFKEPDGETTISNDHCCWIPVLNNMLYNNGTKYADMDGVQVESTLIEWLNEQSKSANEARLAAFEPLEAAFTDVDLGDWYVGYIMNLYQQGIVNGAGNHTFLPDSSTTYGEALKMIMLAVGYEEQAVTDGHWASGYLTKAIEDGLLTETVELDDFIDRLNMAKITTKALGLSTTLTESPFSDTSDPSVLALYEAGVVVGSAGEFRPESTLTRAELSAIVWRVVNN